MKTHIFNVLAKLAKIAATAVAGLVIGVSANAAIVGSPGVTFLIGSDVVSFHGDASFINPVMDQMGNFGSKKILFLNDWGATSTNYTNGNVTFDFQPLGFLTGTTDLSPYSAVYIDSPSSCCSDPGPLMTVGGNTTLAAFLAVGSVAIGDYQGDSYWDSVLGFAGLPGVTDGRVIDPFLCVDPGLSTVGGLAFGFNPSYSEGCFVHQTYDPAFFASKGYFALQTNGDVNSRTAGDWVTMASGFKDPGTVPEPASLVLVGIALAGMAAVRRRKA